MIENKRMNKKEKHREELIKLFETFVDSGQTERLTSYIVSHSNLPGRRANLELTQAFSDVVEEYSEAAKGELWQLCTEMTAISADEAPVNTPEEFVPFCGAMAIGALGSTSPALFQKALAALRVLAHDPRWRMREAVRFGLQRLLASQSQGTLQELREWVTDGDLPEMRAAATSVAAPTALKEKKIANSALQLHRDILAQVLETQDRRSEAFRILRKALGYTLSVVVRAVPEEGFEFMAQLVETQDSDVLWIVKQNLRKNRLLKYFPAEVELLMHVLRPAEDGA